MDLSERKARSQDTALAPPRPDKRADASGFGWVASVANDLAHGLVRLELIILALTYALYVVSDRVPTAGWAALALIWLARLWTTGSLTRRTPFDLPILILLVWLPISLGITTNWGLSLPKVNGLILSLAFFYAVVNHIRDRRDLAWSAFWLALIGLAVAAAGLVGTDWAQGRLIALGPLYDRLPRIIQGLPRSIAGGFARNGVGGTLALLVPLLASLLLARASFREEWGARFAVWYSRLVTAALLLSLGTLGLTLSRGAILGTGAGLLALAILRDRRWAWLLAAAGVGLAVLAIIGQGPALVELLLRMDASNGTLASRVETWQRGLMMLQDFPFTGIGIGTYNEVAHRLYPFFIAAQNEVVAHAHNTILQVGVDLGIPGLVAFVALLTGFFTAAVRAYVSTTDVGQRALLAGLGCGMLAHQTFGLTDAFILGTKPGVLMWVFVALVVAAARVGKQAGEALRVDAQTRFQSLAETHH
jgi:putative inorganic carbon (HCO3(-)) transporter